MFATAAAIAVHSLGLGTEEEGVCPPGVRTPEDLEANVELEGLDDVAPVVANEAKPPGVPPPLEGVPAGQRPPLLSDPDNDESICAEASTLRTFPGC